MRNVLVTGGAGFIGSHVVDLLLSRGCNVSVVDNFSFGKREHIGNGVHLIEADIADRDAVFAAMSADIDSVIHLAAIHFIPYCNQHPDLACRTNIEGTQNVLDAAKAAETVERLFIASTAAVYPDCAGPISEDQARNPLDVYGMSKSANEEQAQILAKRSRTKVSVGRFFNAVGGRETNPHLVPDVLSRIRRSPHIAIGSTAPRRDYIDVRDMATGVLAMLDGNDDQLDICNIGTGITHDVAEIISMIAEIHGAEITYSTSDDLVRKVERMNLQADSSRLQRNYGWRPAYSSMDSMRYAYEWFNG